MAYYSDVRLITTKEGYKLIREFAKTDEDIRNIFVDASTIFVKKYQDFVYMGWNYIDFSIREKIQDFVINELGDNDNSYRYSAIGTNNEDIEELKYTTDEDKKKLIPSPIMDRCFNDNEIEKEYGAD